MSVWTIYRNGKGAKRPDGVYVRRAWNWFPSGRDTRTKVPGWDVCVGKPAYVVESLWITYMDCPLDEVLRKVDERLPEPVNSPVAIGRKYSYYNCSSCGIVSVIDVEGFEYGSDAQVTCCSCGITVTGRYFERHMTRGVELTLGQRVSVCVEVPFDYGRYRAGSSCG